ncbi:GOLPH3/VPS74 family protein [Kitasatospora mediocidica]|uniref:GOLPH3/VPS74 family protein n=1 Tax=Kitasatospora mediocidica TaxID=58352 RepID=UPI00056704C6|nr:GPP34 family phosphoprotein [Kitasatospora mediocidica]
MDLPDTLAGKLYLLACDPETQRLVSRTDLDLLLRAAALTDLQLRGLLQDVDGKPSATGRAPQDLNPVLADLLSRIAETGPHSWGWWIRLHGRGNSPDRPAHPVRSVQDDLAKRGWIRVEEHRVLGLFNRSQITERDPRVRKALAATASTTLRGPVSQVEPADAALVALADAGQLRTVVTRSQRSEFRDRLAVLTEQTGPVPPALRNAVHSRNAARAGT